MNVEKILLIVIVLLSVVSAFVGIPYVGLVLVLAGLAYGVMAIEDDRKVYFLLVAIVLASGAGALGSIPAVGGYLTAILESLSTAASAGAIGVICKGIVDRLT
jgi:hypothetical protein